MSAVPAPERPAAGWHADGEWAQIEIAAPQAAATMRRYLRQLGTFLAPRSRTGPRVPAHPHPPARPRRDHGQADRTALFDGLIQRAEAGPATTEPN